MESRDINQEFLNMYNRLDNYLIKISGVSAHVNMIAYLEKILPEKLQGELKTIRQYKNAVESHGVNPNGKKPTVPREWVSWLREMLSFCKKEEKYIARKLKRELAEISSSKKNTSYSSSNGENKRVTKCDFCQYYNGKKCTNYSYYYGTTKVVGVVNKEGLEFRKNPCPKTAIDEFNNYLGGSKPSASTHNSNVTASSEKAIKTTIKEKRRPYESTSLTDENIKIKASLEKGDGRYVKGIFNKKSFVNFRLLVSIQNQNGLKISKVTAYIKGKGEQMEKRISTALESQTEFDLPVDTYGGNIEASVVVMYKIGLFKTKQIKVTVSKNF